MSFHTHVAEAKQEETEAWVHSQEEANRPCGKINGLTKVARPATTNRTWVGTSVQGLFFHQSRRFDEMLSNVLQAPAFAGKEVTLASVAVVAQRIADAHAINNGQISPDELNEILYGCEESYGTVGESDLLATETNVRHIGSSLHHERVHDSPYGKACQPELPQGTLVKRPAGPPSPPSQISLAEQVSSVPVMKWLWYFHTKLKLSQLTWCAFGQVLQSYAEKLGGAKFPRHYHFLFVDTVQDIPNQLREIVEPHLHLAKLLGHANMHFEGSPYSFKVSR